MNIEGIHHVAVICSDYERSKHFYTDILRLRIIREVFRQERQSYKLDLQLPDGTQIELFSFPNAPARPSYPEARGLRHLAFRVADIHASIRQLLERGIQTEDVRIDEYTGRQFTFFPDPDGLPIELYEIPKEDE